VPDAATRHALLLILAVLERHSRALRTLLAKAGRPELEGLLGDVARRERALREAACVKRPPEVDRFRHEELDLLVIMPPVPELRGRSSAAGRPAASPLTGSCRRGS
jgi:hypothetical protein